MVIGQRCWINITLLGIALGNVLVGADETDRCDGDACFNDAMSLLQPTLQHTATREWLSLSSQSPSTIAEADSDAFIGTGIGWGITSIVALVGLTISVAAFTVSGWLFPLLSARVVSYAVCGIYIGLSVAIDLTIATQKTKNGRRMYAFNPVCTVILTETVKLMVSGVLLLTRKLHSGQPILPPDVLTLASDIKWLSLPATLFTVNNILVFVALGSNDTAAFGIFRDTIILWTAIIWWWVFRASLGYVRFGGIMLLFCGLVLNRAGHLFYNKQAWSWQFLWVLLMTLTNAMGSVANEFALKRNAQLDLNLQNAILYTMCITFSFFLLAIADSPRILGGPAAFFSGFTASTMLMVGLQALAGLLVSRLLKYADAVTKSVATCLRGPALVLISPAFVHSPLDAGTVASSITVALGCCIYLTQGPLVTAKGAVATQAELAPEVAVANALKNSQKEEDSQKKL